MPNHLTISLPKTLWPLFYQLLQEGIWIKGPTGIDLESFLVEHAGICAEDLCERVQTVFLNGQPVDDTHTACIADGDVVALSAAMPGLLGATLRKGGFYAGLRREISHHQRRLVNTAQNGRITLKIFNLLLRDFGPGLLSKGFYLSAHHLHAFLSGQADTFWRACRQILFNAEAVTPHQILSNKIEDTEILMVLTT